MSLIILAKSGEGRQKEEKRGRRKGAVGRRREMGCRSEMDLRFRPGEEDRCGVVMWEICMIGRVNSLLSDQIGCAVALEH